MLLRVMIALGIALAGCGESNVPSPPNDGSLGEDALSSEGDLDNDGLCDFTEIDNGLDPEDNDSDGDGFPDGIEAYYGYDPHRPAEPERPTVLGLAATPGTRASIAVEVNVRAGGEDYVGSFDAVPAAGQLDAAHYFLGARALGAEPAENAAAIEGDLERFRGVVGDTALRFELDFAIPLGDRGDCTAGYPFRYIVKRSDGVVVASRRFLLVAGDPGPLFEADGWCALPPPCF